MIDKNTACDLITKEQPSAWTGHRYFAKWLVETVQPNVIVDLGVDYGHSTFYLAAAGIGEVYGVDTFDYHYNGESDPAVRNTFDYVSNFKNQHGFDNVTFIKGKFDEVAKTWNKKIDILHIDGIHTYADVKGDYDAWKSFLNEDSIVLFHDTDSFPEVNRFFNDCDLTFKIRFNHSAGLGVASNRREVLDEIFKHFN